MLEQGQHSDPDVRTEYVVNSLKQMQQIGADIDYAERQTYKVYHRQ